MKEMSIIFTINSSMMVVAKIDLDKGAEWNVESSSLGLIDQALFTGKLNIVYEKFAFISFITHLLSLRPNTHNP